MSMHLYDVTLVDLGTYRLTVAADSPDEAVSIAKTTLTEEAAAIPGMAIAKRELDGSANLTERPPLRMFRVHGTYSLGLQIDVPAHSREEAETHARRLYENQSFPWEYANDGGSVSWGYVREIVS